MRATFFETFRFSLPDGTLLDVGSPTTRSLFAYLLLNRRRPSDRRRLAFLFWPNASESAARRNLRQYIHRIRTALGTAGDLLTISGSTIQFNPQAALWLDVETFTHGVRPTASLPEIQAALTLYTGDFMQDFYDEWCQSESERLRALYLNSLDRLTRELQSAGQVEQALPYATAWVKAEPLDENAHCRQISLYAIRGDRGHALHLYQTLTETLKTELGVSPMPETTELWRKIQNGEMPALQPPAAPAPMRRPEHAPAASAEPASRWPLVGRGTELSLLEESYQQAGRGQGQILLISGEPGIGKTRLVQEFLARHPETALMQSACYELEAMVPFAALRRALETSRLPAPEIRPSPAEAWNNALTNLSRALAGKTICLILDDLHWGDVSTWEWLASLARHLARPAILVLGLCRLEELPGEQRTLLRSLENDGVVQHMHLPRLPSLQASELVRILLPERANDLSLVERLAQDTAGNPFFIVETVRALRETGMRLQPAGPLPTSIQRVIESRLDRLSAPSREALTTLSALGRAFPLTLMQEICQLESEICVTRLEEWLARGLVEENGAGGYDFRHDQIRQATYSSLSQARRQLIHGRIARALEQAIPPADSATLTYHFSRSDQPLKALPFLIQAGEQALRLRSYHETRQFGLQAISLLGQMPGLRQSSERIDINLQLAQAYAFTGDLQRAVEILDETSQMAHTLGDEARLGQIFRRSAQFFWLLGRPALAADYARRTLRVAEELNDAELLFAALRMLGRVSIALAAFDDAIAYLMRYVNLHESAVTHLPGDLPIVLGYLGVAYVRVGALERAQTSANRGLTLAEEKFIGGGPASTVIFARMQLAMVYASLHEWQICLQTLESLPETPAEEEITPALYMALSLRGYARAQSGQHAEGIADLQAAVAWAERRRYHVFDYLPYLFLAESLLLGGQIDSATEYATRALEKTQKADNRWAEAIGERLLAEIVTRQPAPDWPQVETRLIQSMQILRQVRARPDLAWTYLALRRLYDRAGQIAWAVDCHFRATTIFEELGMSDALCSAQGQAGRERHGAVVIPNLPLSGLNGE
ncbi:MAG: hypothetical protein CO094_00240 [Anaerolineae bacterium CG_4_9_14_3_um_filter_57_17]|nr:MAG: hypothetical protein CO094_00240 [Anaerolineae bacterium CG_4_9_14_3_um_filter_57_17]